jgi:hypothetical protein
MKTGPLGDHELDVIHGGFFLMELLVQINQVAIIIGIERAGRLKKFATLRRGRV